jgi:hypothetical protein
MCKVAAVAKFEVQPRNLPGGTEENDENPPVGSTTSEPKFEIETSRIRSRSADHSTATSGVCGVAQLPSIRLVVGITLKMYDLKPIGI